MTDTTTATTDVAPIPHAVNLANVFTQAALDAAGCDIKPVAITVNTYTDPTRLAVDVQIGRRDTAAVDRLADFYALPAADPLQPGTELEDHALYTREGAAVVAGDPVHVRIYSGRPDGGAA